jgi:hypothetical protein
MKPKAMKKNASTHSQYGQLVKGLIAASGGGVRMVESKRPAGDPAKNTHRPEKEIPMQRPRKVVRHEHIVRVEVVISPLQQPSQAEKEKKQLTPPHPAVMRKLRRFCSRPIRAPRLNYPH